MLTGWSVFPLGSILNMHELVETVGSLNSTTTTGSELQCTAQARQVNFVVVVSSTTPNKVESRRPATHELREVLIHCFKRFLKSVALYYSRKSRCRSFFLLTSDVDWKFDKWINFTSKNDNSYGSRASELVSDKFIRTNLGKANHISLI